MKKLGTRTTFSSLALLLRDVTEWPEQSSRGDEHLCAICAKRAGTRPSGDGRLVCDTCPTPTRSHQ